MCGEQSPLAALVEGEVPQLAELRLHESTVWHWNRPVFDPASGGHLRIELRTLPAGPSIVDMLANSAWLLGLAAGLQPMLDELLPALPFDLARHNFYTAARDGLAARLVWPLGRSPAPRELSVIELARRGVESTEAEHWLAVMDERMAVGCNGASWQLAALARLETRMSRSAALRALLELYIEHQVSGRSVAEWECPNDYFHSGPQAL